MSVRIRLHEFLPLSSSAKFSFASQRLCGSAFTDVTFGGRDGLRSVAVWTVWPLIGIIRSFSMTGLLGTRGCATV